MNWRTDPQIWISLVTFTVLEIVVGIDQIRRRARAQDTRVKLHQPYR